MSRGSLKILLTGFIGTVFLLIGFFGTAINSQLQQDSLPASNPIPVLGASDTTPSADAQTSFISVVVATTEGKSYDGSWQPADAANEDVKKLVNLVQTELSVYDRAFLGKIGLQKVIIVTKLKVSGQYRSGMPDAYLNEAVILDSDSTYVNARDDYMRRVIHHELHHFMEYNLYGTFTRKDTRWSSCNPSGTRYGKGGASMYSDSEYANKLHPKKGFITGYATSGIEEDKAETFAYYMTDRGLLESLAKDDQALACKLNNTITAIY